MEDGGGGHNMGVRRLWGDKRHWLLRASRHPWCNRHAPPPKKKFVYVFCIPFCIRMLRNKAYRAWESILNWRGSGALQALDPAIRDFARTCNILCPPPRKSWICPPPPPPRKRKYGIYPCFVIYGLLNLKNNKTFSIFGLMNLWNTPFSIFRLMHLWNNRPSE